MKEDLIQLLADLVAIDSTSATLAGGPGEAAIAQWIARWLTDLGLSPELQTVAQHRRNVVALVRGEDHARAVMFNAHLDTVGVEGMPKPFELVRSKDRLFGRGTYDMKGSIAVLLLLARHWIVTPPPIDVWITLVADEEDKSLGMDHLIAHWLPTLPRLPIGALFLEPTELHIGIGHKGFTWYEIEITGRAAHGSRPSEGIDAIMPLGAALSELQGIQTELAALPQDALLGHASLHPGTISGGSALSVIPAQARLQWERRTLPGESLTTVDGEMGRIVDAVNRYSGDHRVTGRRLFSRPSYALDRQADLVRRLQAASPGSELQGVSFWADAALCGAAGVPSLLFGPAGHGAHAIDEWVSLSSLMELYQVIQRLITNYRTK